MGYTNYWTQATDFTEDQWSKVKMEADYIRSWSEISAIAKYVGVIIKRNTIEIVGGCENFVLNKPVGRDPPHSFQTAAQALSCSLKKGLG